MVPSPDNAFCHGVCKIWVDSGRKLPIAPPAAIRQIQS